MNRKRLIPLITPLTLLILNELVLIYPKIFFVALSLGVILIFFSVRILGRETKEKFWPFYAILPILVFLSFSAYSALIASSLLVQIFFLAAFVLNFYYLRAIYYYLLKEEFARETQISSFSTLVAVFIIFCLYSSVYLLPLFINIKPALLAFMPLPAACFLFFSGTKSVTRSIKSAWIILIINTIILGQISWIISYLPINPHILGFLISLSYYLLIIISVLYFRNNLNKKTIRWPLAITLLSAIALLIATRWL